MTGMITSKLDQANIYKFAYWLCLLVTVVSSILNGDHDYEPIIAM